mmetsp:Transcript_81160/g.250477  ORF Transcript_81160/g.250477 Transcript_81160/m.250477 type:complete len:122 (+) Transcript_81160:157-522(+)
MDSLRLSSDLLREDEPEAADIAAALRTEGVRSCWALLDPVSLRSPASACAGILIVPCSKGVEELEDGWEGCCNRCGCCCKAGDSVLPSMTFSQGVILTFVNGSCSGFSFGPCPKSVLSMMS